MKRQDDWNGTIERTIEELEIDLSDWGFWINGADLEIEVEYEGYDPGLHTYPNGDPGYPPSGGGARAYGIRRFFNVILTDENGKSVDYPSLPGWKMIQCNRSLLKHFNNDWLESQEEWALEAVQAIGVEMEEQGM